MIEFISALQAVLTIVLLVVIGYILQKRNVITDEIGEFISFFVVNITLPCGVFRTLTTTITADRLVSMPLFVVIIILSQITSMGVAYILARFRGISEQKKGSFIAMTAFNNTLFMGMPVSVALFGESNASIIIYYYVASTILFWTVGIRIIAGKKINGTFKLPKPFYGIAAAFFVILFRQYVVNFELPVFIDDTIGYMASMTTPLSMIFTGFALGQFGLKNIQFDESVWLGIFARFILSPFIFIIAVSFLPVEPIAKNVFIVQAFMPVMASQTIIARQYGVDDKYPAVMVTVTTLLSLIIIPIVKVIIT